jgi:DNA repair protein RecO (recombination protein O)
LAAEQTDAIVLRIYPWSETSCIASILTRDHGKLSVLAKGARRPKSPFEAALDLLSFCRVVFLPKSGDALDLLTEAKLQKRFRAGARDILRLYCGYYVAELVDRLTDRGDKQPELYELAECTLLALHEPAYDPRAIILRFELQILRMVGHLPSWRVCVQCGTDVPIEETAVIGVLAGGVLCENCIANARYRVQLSGAVRQTLEQFSIDDWRSIPMSVYPVKNRGPIRSIVKQYLQVLLDRKLSLHPYLEELGR